MSQQSIFYYSRCQDNGPVTGMSPDMKEKTPQSGLGHLHLWSFPDNSELHVLRYFQIRRTLINTQLAQKMPWRIQPVMKPTSLPTNQKAKSIISPNSCKWRIGRSILFLSTKTDFLAKKTHCFAYSTFRISAKNN